MVISRKLITGFLEDWKFFVSPHPLLGSENKQSYYLRRLFDEVVLACSLSLFLDLVQHQYTTDIAEIYLQYMIFAQQTSHEIGVRGRYQTEPPKAPLLPPGRCPRVRPVLLPSIPASYYSRLS